MAQAWRVLIAVCIIYFVTAGTILYGMSVVMKPLIADMGWTRAQGTSGITVLMLATGLLGPLVSALIDRFNIRNTVLIGAACVALGSASAYATAGLVQYYLSLALLGFGMSAMTFIPMSQLVARWFVRRRGLAMGMLLTSSGLGAFVMTPFLALVLEHTGSWRMLFAIMGATAPLSAILAFLLLRNHPANKAEIDAGRADAGQQAAHKTKVYQSSVDWNLKDALRAKSLWLIIAAFAMCLLGVNLINSQAILHLTDMGIGQVLAGSAIGTMGLCSVAGRLGGGILGDRIEPKFLLAMGLLLQAAGFVTLLFADRDVLVYGFALIFGIGLGLSIVTAPLMLANYFGTGSLARINATTGIFTIGVTAFAPTIAGYASDTLGSYTLVFLSFSALAALLAIPVALLKPPMPIQSSAPAP